MNLDHSNMSFSFKSEFKNKISFLDLKLLEPMLDSKRSFTINLKSLSRIFSHFDSSLPTISKFSMIYTLANRRFKIYLK